MTHSPFFRLAGVIPLLLCTAPLAAQVPNAAIPGRPAPQIPAVPAPLPAASPGMAPQRPAPAMPQQFVNATETAIDQQTKGQFPAMERSPSLPLGTLQRSWDRPSAASGQAAPGVVHYMWHPDFVMSVRTRDFMVTTVILPAWERVNEFYVGDPVVFEAKRIRPNVVALRSRNAGADSNLTVLGSGGNIYNFYVRSETWNSSQLTDLTVYVDAPRPADEMDGVGSGGPEGVGGGDQAGGYGAVAGMPDFVRKIVFRPENLQFDMKMYAANESDVEIAPERVFEDGVFTYFDFGERSDSTPRPVVHQLVDGVDTVVNSRTAGPRGSVLVAEAVGDFTLRSGARVVCVRRLNSRSTAVPVDIGGDMPEPRVSTAPSRAPGAGSAVKE